MLTAISWLNSALTLLFEVLVWPFRSLSPIWALGFLSMVTGLFMLWVFAGFSNQEGIKASKDKVRGNLLGVRIFQHDIWVVLRLQARILRETLTYFRYSLFPLVVMLLPLVLILIQLNLFFSKRPIPVDGQTILTVAVDPAREMTGPISLQPSNFYRVETDPVRVQRLNEISWRIRALEPGRHTIPVQVGDEVIEKELVVGESWDAVSPVRTSETVDLIFYSGEQPVSSSSGVRSIEVEHAPLSIPIFGWHGDWFLLFLIFSVVSAFLFKGLFGVEL